MQKTSSCMHSKVVKRNVHLKCNEKLSYFQHKHKNYGLFKKYYNKKYVIKSFEIY